MAVVITTNTYKIVDKTNLNQNTTKTGREIKQEKYDKMVNSYQNIWKKLQRRKTPKRRRGGDA